MDYDREEMVDLLAGKGGKVPASKSATALARAALNAVQIAELVAARL